jgi:hypothetical protein
VPVSVSNGGVDLSQMNDLHNTSGIQEYILDEDDCPLRIEKMHSKAHGVLTFHIRRRPADYQPRKRKKKPLKQMNASKDEMDHASLQASHSPAAGYWTNHANESHDINDTNSGKFAPHVPHAPHAHKSNMNTNMNANTNANTNTNATPPPLPDSHSDIHMRFPVGSSIQSSDTISEPATPTLMSAPLSMGSEMMSLPHSHSQMNHTGRASAVLATIEPEVQVVIFQKSNNGMGLSIVAAKGINQENLGIYIKSVVKGGAADAVSYLPFPFLSFQMFVTIIYC